MAGENDDPLKIPSEDLARERFRKIREELEAMELPTLPSDEELRLRIPLTDASHSTDRFPDAPHVEINKRNPAINLGDDKGNARGLGMGITVAYSLVGAMVVGALIGYTINHTMGVAFGAVIGACVGIGFAFHLMNKD